MVPEKTGMLRRVLIRAVQAPVRLYRLALSPLLGPACRFHPTCSAYMIEALEKRGVVKGLFLGLRRLLSCHPWSGKGGIDPVP